MLLSSQPSACTQNDSRSLYLAGWERAGAGLPLQKSPLLGIQTDGSGYTHFVVLYCKDDAPV